MITLNSEKLYIDRREASGGSRVANIISEDIEKGMSQFQKK